MGRVINLGAYKILIGVNSRFLKCALLRSIFQKMIKNRVVIKRVREDVIANCFTAMISLVTREKNPTIVLETIKSIGVSFLL